MATVLWAGSGAAISGRSAAELHGLLDPASGPIEVIGTVNRSSGPGIVHHRRPLKASEIALVDNIPVLGVPRTLLDLCNSIGRSSCEIALNATLRDGVVEIDELRTFAAKASKRRLGGG